MIERYDVNESWVHSGIIKQEISVSSVTALAMLVALSKNRLMVHLTTWNEDCHLLGLPWTMWYRWIVCLEIFGISQSWKRSLKNGSTASILCVSPSRLNLPTKAESMVFNSRLMVLRIAINN